MKKVDQIILLAGGESSRFWPLRDKAFTRLIGKTFMEHLIKELSIYSDKIYIVSNPRYVKKITQDAADISKTHKTNIVAVPQKDGLEGLGGAVMTLEGVVKGETIVANISDIFDPSHIEALFKTAQEKNAFFVLSVQKVDSYFPGGYLVLEGTKLKGIDEKPVPGNEPSDMVKLVLDYVADIAQFIEILKTSKKQGRDSYEVGINEVIARGLTIEYTLYKGPWIALKYPWDVLTAMDYFFRDLKSYKDKTASVGEHTTIEGPVWIGAGAKIGNYTRIVGPVYIAPGAIIGDYCMVRGSHIDTGAVVGGYSEVTRSYIGQSTMLHRNYVGDSVLDANVLMGAGALTANFRFDEKSVKSQVKHEKVSSGRNKLGAIIGDGSKIGVQTTILPGVKIGAKSFVAPASVVREDIPDGMYFKDGQVVTNRS